MISGYTETLGAMIMMATSLIAENPLYEIELEKMDAQETFCLAQNIWFEARSTSIEDQTLVGMTTMNRVRDRRYSETICEVVWEPSQFSWTDDGKPDRIEFANNNDVRIWNEIVRISVLMRAGYVEDKSSGATHYHAHYVNPKWAKANELLISTDGHKYYRSANYQRFIDEENNNTNSEKKHKLMQMQTMMEVYSYIANTNATNTNPYSELYYYGEF